MYNNNIYNKHEYRIHPIYTHIYLNMHIIYVIHPHM